MSITLSGTANSNINTGVTSFSRNMPSGMAAGSLCFIVITTTASPAASTVTGISGTNIAFTNWGSYTYNVTGATYEHVEVWVGYGIGGTPSTTASVTLSTASNVQTGNWASVLVTGADSISPFDGSLVFTNNAAGATTLTSGSYTNTYANDALIGIIVQTNGGGGSIAGFNIGDQATGGALQVYTYYKNLTSIQANTITFTTSTTTPTSAIAIIGGLLATTKTKTQTSTADIQVTTPHTQTCTAAISGAGNYTQFCTADIRATTQQTQSCAAAITTTLSQTYHEVVKLVGTGSVPYTAGSDSGQGYRAEISKDGSTVGLGSWGDNSQQGAVWIFRNINGTWTQQGSKLTPSDSSGSTPWFGRALCLSSDGNRAIIGAMGDTGQIGAFWLFENNGSGTWVQQGSKIVPSDVINGTNGCDVGYSFAISDDDSVLLVAGQTDNNEKGAVWVYNWNGTTYTEYQKLIPSDPGTPCFFGYDCAISSDGLTAVIGSQTITTTNTVGGIWVFENIAGTWTQVQSKILPVDAIPGAVDGDNFGFTVSIWDNIILAGAYLDNTNIGAAYWFENVAGVWTEVQKSKPYDSTGSTPHFCRSSSMRNGVAAIAACDNDNYLGGFWVWKNYNGLWIQQPVYIPSDLVGTITYFGRGIAASNDAHTIVIGASGDSSVTGAGYIYSDLAITTQSQSCAAVIRNTTPQTQTCTAQIQALTLTQQTQVCAARIQVAANQHTQTSVSRIQVTTPHTQSSVADVRATTQKPQTGVSRIQVAANQKPQAGVSRIQVTASGKIQTCTSRIQSTTPGKTQAATARIQVAGNQKAQSSVADIRATTQRPQSSTANIRVTTPRSQTSVSRVQVTAPHTQSAIANIRVTTPRTQSCIATIQALGVTQKSQSSIARIQVAGNQHPQSSTAKILTTSTTQRPQSSAADIRVTTPHTQSCAARIQVADNQKPQTGASRIQVTTPRTQSSVASIRATTQKSQSSVSDIRVTTQKPQTGISRIQITSSQPQAGTAIIAITTQQTQSCNANIFNPAPIPHTQTCTALIYVISTTDRSIVVPFDDRTSTVPAQDRTLLVPIQSRICTVNK